VGTVQLFVAALGASHTRAFAFIGGTPAMVVCDNLRSGITKACFYEPAVNRTYAEMAAHYDTAIVPARPYRARDKAGKAPMI
jgi:transposase